VTLLVDLIILIEGVIGESLIRYWWL